MTRWEWVVKVLSESAKEELPSVYKKWLFDNVVRRNIRVKVGECICNELDWTDKYTGVYFVQEEKTALWKDFIDRAKPALVLVPLPYIGEFKNPCYFVYWYNPSIEMPVNISKTEKVSCKVRRFNLPKFEEWNKNNKVEVNLGAYRVEIRAFSWGDGYIRYGFAMALSNCNALNVYTDKLFSSFFKYEYEAGETGLEQWYDSTVATFYDFWEQYINAMYLEPDV